MGKTRSAIRTNDPVGMRNRVLDVAAGAFQGRGYTATSMHDIGREAAVSGGALYHHFPSKKALALAVIAERVSPEVGERWCAAVRDAHSAAAGVLGVFDDLIAHLDTAGRVEGCPIGNIAVELSLADDDLRRALADEYAKWRDAIADRLRADRASYAADPDAFANVVVAMCSGALMVAKAEQGTNALRACALQLRHMMADA